MQMSEGMFSVTLKSAVVRLFYVQCQLWKILLYMLARSSYLQDLDFFSPSIKINLSLFKWNSVRML